MSYNVLKLKYCILVFGLLILCTGHSSAQSYGNIILNHADSLVGEGDIRQLFGNVNFTHGKTNVTCNRAIQYRISNIVTLDGEVIVREDSLTMKAFHGVYYGKTRVINASGHVRLDDGKIVLWADSGTYDLNNKKAHFISNVIVQDSLKTLHADDLTHLREEQITIALGNVTINSPENNITLTGNHFENYRKRKYTMMTEHPVSIHVDTTSTGELDTLTVISDTMETYQDAVPRMIAHGNVSILRSDMSAECGFGVFYTKLDSMELRNSPIVWHIQDTSTTQTSGDSMFVKLNQRRLQTLYIRGHAFAISEVDTIHHARFHQMNGQDIEMNFTENKISRLDIDRTATMLYYLFDDKKPNGLNNTTGDHITVSFEKGKVEQLKVIGGVDGKFVPEKLVAGREQEYNLNGFNWKTRTKKNK